MKYEFVQRLMQVFDRYQAENLPLSLEDFGMWLVTVDAQGQDKEPEKEIPEKLAMYLNVIGKFYSYYHKKILKQTDLTSLDELVFLKTLYPDRILSKTDLIDENILEKTTGVEIIKRLKRKGYLEEFGDLEDKRKKNVTLSPTGKSLVEQLEEEFVSASKIMGGNLAGEEQIQLYYLLQKLDDFHRTVYSESRDLQISDIQATWMDPLAD